MQPRGYLFLDELNDAHRKREHYQRFVKYYEELTAFDKKRCLKRVKYPGWISWFIWQDRAFRDPHPSKIPKWAVVELVVNKNDN